jgi:hypothetical protein
MIWSKQFFYYDIGEWIKGDPKCPPPPGERRHGHNADWQHLNNADIISMPDKWEYPWYAAWDNKVHEDIGDEGIGLWNEQDEFYYDVLNLPNGNSVPLRVRSMVGLIPLFAVETLEPELLAELPGFTRRLEWFLKYRPNLAKLVSRWKECGDCERHLLSLLRGHRMKCLLRRMLDETEFLSDFGVRALSKVYEPEPYQFHTNGHTMEVGYWRGESLSGLFGGNSNWRWPIWMPVNYLLIESLQKFHHYYGDDFKIECPARSWQVRPRP